MVEKFMSKGERADLFAKLRKDVKIYLTKYLKKEEYYEKRRINEAEDENIILSKLNSGERMQLEALISSMAKPDRWTEYGMHKHNLSLICGWHAGMNCNQEQFNMAMEYLVDYHKL